MEGNWIARYRLRDEGCKTTIASRVPARRDTKRGRYSGEDVGFGKDDDEKVLVDLVKERLEANGYDVITATDGVEGIVKAKEDNPDLIILDVLMPNLDGHGFIKEMKRIEEIKKTPVIVFTAKPDLHQMFEDEGVLHYIIKPYDANQFLAKINEIWETPIQAD